VRVRITPRVPLHARLAQRQSGGPTNLRSGFRNSHRVPSCVFSSAAERALDMREAAGSPLQDAPPLCSCISVAENAADNRGTQVRFLTGAPTRNHHHEHRWQTGLRTRRVKPEWRGSGLLTRPQVDRNHPGPPFKGPLASTAERRTLNPRGRSSNLRWPSKRDRGGIGLRKRLRSVAREGSGFDPRRSHQIQCSVTLLVWRSGCQPAERRSKLLPSAIRV
jgi:hypothetical protein